MGFLTLLEFYTTRKIKSAERQKKKTFSVFFFLFAITPVGEIVYFLNFVRAIWELSFIFGVKGLICFGL
jgi:hypothetical protein